MANDEIRKHAKQSGVKLWQVAEKLCVCDMTLSRKLRHELPDEEKTKILALIDEIAKKEGA